MPTSTHDPRDDAALLEQQLHDALEDAQAGRAPAFEVALLAGLRERLPGDAPILASVESWIEGEGADRLADELPRIQVAPRAEALLDSPSEDADDERVDALLAFDELCAGLTFCGASRRCEPAAHLVARSVRAHPQPWATLSNLASRILQHAAPVADDPAGIVWRAVEAAERLWQQSAAETAEVAQIASIPRERRLAASTRDPKVITIPLGEHAHLTFVESVEGAELLVHLDDHATTIAAQRDGQSVVFLPVSDRPGTWRCPADTGLYVLFLNGIPFPFNLG